MFDTGCQICGAENRRGIFRAKHPGGSWWGGTGNSHRKSGQVQSSLKRQWKTWEHTMLTAETSARLRMELLFELGVVGPEELRGAGVNPWACMWDAQALVKKQSLCRLLGLPAHARDCYEINGGTLNLWRVYLSKRPFQLGNIKPEVVRRNPPTGAGAKLL